MSPLCANITPGSRAFALTIAVTVSLAWLVGCGSEEPVVSYKVPKADALWEDNHVDRKDDVDKADVKPTKKGKPGRMLGAIATVGETNWYLKLLGPLDPVSAQAEDVDAFLKSVKFTGDDGEKQPQWTLPEGWTQIPADDPRNKGGTSGFSVPRFATIDIVVNDEKLELTVIALGADVADPAGDLLANVNRWRGQVMLSPVELKELKDSVSPHEVDGITVYIVDFEGHLKPRGMGRAPFFNR
jgi:hypothetical protein